MTSPTPKLSVFQSRQKTENLSVMLVYLWDRKTSLFPCQLPTVISYMEIF